MHVGSRFVMATVVAAAYGPMGDGWHEWHHHLANLPSLLSLLALPLLLGLLAIVLSAGRYVSSRVRNRFTRPKAPNRSVGESSDATPVLASDAEREGAASRIAHAMGEARLSLDEGLARIDALWNTRHRHEVDRLVADLPVSDRASAPRNLYPASAPRRLLRVILAVLVLSAVLMQAIFGLWEFWPAAVAGSLVAGFAARR
jgi:Domain of unknown function (DUF1707)